MIPRIWIVVSVYLLAGCGSPVPDGHTSSSGLAPGKVYECIKCRNYPSYTYAVYLPTTYNSIDSFPVFLAFDPGGAGIKPVTRYREVAEKYGFILIGSNDSRNGQGAGQTQQIMSVLQKEIGSRYTVDPKRIYCTGFSGGSRVSSIIAYYVGGIRGVVGCGAGLPGTSSAIRYRPDYFGLVGDGDFNYVEMVELPSLLDGQKVRNSLRIFHGPHDWPPAEEFEAAVRWHWSNAMNDGILPADPAMIPEVDRAFRHDREILQSINPHDLERERKRQSIYQDAMQSQNVHWWQMEMKKLDHPSSVADTLVNKRLISYLGVIAYSFANQALAAEDKENLARMIGIYETVDPGNSYISFLKDQLTSLP